jgi:hypothetical protein
MHVTEESPSTDLESIADVVSIKAPEMLVLDNPSDFRFHAAYLAYSEAWTNNAESRVRHELNELLQALHTEDNFPRFYQAINQYRTPGEAPSRTRFKAKKKRAWRRSEAKKSRLSRHKK